MGSADGLLVNLYPVSAISHAQYRMNESGQFRAVVSEAAFTRTSCSVPVGSLVSYQASGCH